MNILQVTNFFKPFWASGGVARVSYEISKHLVDRGHSVTVYTSNIGIPDDIEINKPVVVDGIEVYYFKDLIKFFRYKFKFGLPYYSCFVMKKQIKDFDIIHIHEHRSSLAMIVRYYAKKYGVPYILQSHGSVLPFYEKQGLKNFFDYIIGSKILLDAVNLIALTQVEVEQYKKMGQNEKKIIRIPNGIDFSEYTHLPKKGQFRRKYCIQENEKIILFLGRINKIKGLDLLLRAFVSVMNQINNVKLVIVGPDDGFLSTIKKQVKEFEIQRNVLYTGPIYNRDKLEAYVDADVYVLPSFYETFPITIIEACACGTPIIVTDKCAIASWINKIGYVVKYDEKQLRNAILKMLRNEELRKRFGKESRKLIEENFNWNVIVKKIEDIYETNKKNKT